MGKKRLMRRLEFEVEIRRAEPATLRQVAVSERYLKRAQVAEARAWSAGSNLIYIIGDWLDNKPRRWAWSVTA